jgi:threonylcarbamoyladenosine tRNA methylthiotransferase MtaB
MPSIALEELLEMIAERSPIGRIRISSLDPEELSDRIVSIVAQSNKFCPHFHLPLQAGEDDVLARMRRRYTTAHYRERVERIVEAIPDVAIGTDLIVGFPGESSLQFDQCFKFVEGLPLAYFHVFPYSVRAGTTAAKLGGKVASSEIKRRAAAMRDLGEHKRVEFAHRMLGTRLRVLLEERSEGRLTGYSRNYVRVITDGPEELTNFEVEVEASFVQGAAVVGQITQTCDSPRTATTGDSA